jgi:hypothetical protein
MRREEIIIAKTRMSIRTPQEHERPGDRGGISKQGGARKRMFLVGRFFIIFSCLVYGLILL